MKIIDKIINGIKKTDGLDVLLVLAIAVMLVICWAAIYQATRSQKTTGIIIDIDKDLTITKVKIDDKPIVLGKDFRMFINKLNNNTQND